MGAVLLLLVELDGCPCALPALDVRRVEWGGGEGAHHGEAHGGPRMRLSGAGGVVEVGRILDMVEGRRGMFRRPPPWLGTRLSGGAVRGFVVLAGGELVALLDPHAIAGSAGGTGCTGGAGRAGRCGHGSAGG